MTARRPVDGFIEKLMDVLSLILQEPRTPRQIIDITDYKPDTIHKYLDKGLDFGLVYITRYEPPSGPGRAPQPVYAFQPGPFENQSAQVPRAPEDL